MSVGTSEFASGVVPILMPSASNSMEEGMILRWNVSEGDNISTGDILCEIETDKATMDFESPAQGIVAQLVVEPGESVKVKSVIAYLCQTEQAYQSFKIQKSDSENRLDRSPEVGEGLETVITETIPSQHVTKSNFSVGRAIASPAVRRLAREKKVNLDLITTGSGPGGRILSIDVEKAEAKHNPLLSASSPKEKQIPLSKMRRVIAKRLSESKREIPHFYLRLRIDATEILKTYHRLREELPCKLNDLFVWSCVKCLQEFPEFRRRLVDESMVEELDTNIGIAVAIQEGLVVPVILAAQKLSFKEFVTNSAQLVAEARRGNVLNSGKGAMTVTNLGMYGIDEFTAIINPPESAILAVGAVREDVVVRQSAIIATHTVTLTLSADHRILDGVVAARFLDRLKNLLTQPDQMLS